MIGVKHICTLIEQRIDVTPVAPPSLLTNMIGEGILDAEVQMFNTDFARALFATRGLMPPIDLNTTEGLLRNL